MPPTQNNGSMPKEERIVTILNFLDDRNAMFPPKPLYDNLVEYENITFSYRTVKRLLKELVDDGRLEYLDLGKGYYRISDKGREYLADWGSNS